MGQCDKTAAPGETPQMGEKNQPDIELANHWLYICEGVKLSNNMYGRVATSSLDLFLFIFLVTQGLAALFVLVYVWVFSSFLPQSKNMQD